MIVLSLEELSLRGRLGFGGDEEGKNNDGKRRDGKGQVPYMSVWWKWTVHRRSNEK